MPDQYSDIMSPIKKEIISFENGREAIAVFPGANASGEQIASALELGYLKRYPKAVLLIIGGAEGVDQNLRPRLLQLFSRGIARAAADVNAVIIDGGTESGVMSMMGQGVADRGYRSSLVGVAPIGQVNYPDSSQAASSDQAPLEPNHSHFVLVKGNAWGAELASMFNLAEEWMTKASGLVVLVNGGSNSKKEALQAVRRKLPLVVVQGSGGLADMITTSLLSKGSISEVDPEISEIIEDGDIRILSLSRPFKEIEAYFLNELGEFKAN